MEKITTFSRRLQALLDIKGITKAQLSRDTGISKSSLTHYVRGDWEAKSDAVYAIAKATMVRSSWLMGYDTPMDIIDDADPPAQKAPIPDQPAPAAEDAPLLSLFHQLNQEGRKKVVEYAGDLVANGKYSLPPFPTGAAM